MVVLEEKAAKLVDRPQNVFLNWKMQYTSLYEFSFRFRVLKRYENKSIHLFCVAFDSRVRLQDHLLCNLTRWELLEILWKNGSEHEAVWQ